MLKHLDNINLFQRCRFEYFQEESAHHQIMDLDLNLLIQQYHPILHH